MICYLNQDVNLIDDRPTFYRIVKRGSTEEFSGLPYVCTLLQTSLWVYYGFTKPGAVLVATVNIVGTAMEIIFVALFLIYASSPRKRVSLFHHQYHHLCFHYYDHDHHLPCLFSLRQLCWWPFWMWGFWEWQFWLPILQCMGMFGLK